MASQSRVASASQMVLSSRVQVSLTISRKRVLAARGRVERQFSSRVCSSFISQPESVCSLRWQSRARKDSSFRYASRVIDPEIDLYLVSSKVNLSQFPLRSSSLRQLMPQPRQTNARAAMVLSKRRTHSSSCLFPSYFQTESTLPSPLLCRKRCLSYSAKSDPSDSSFGLLGGLLMGSGREMSMFYRSASCNPSSSSDNSSNNMPSLSQLDCRLGSPSYETTLITSGRSSGGLLSSETLEQGAKWCSPSSSSGNAGHHGSTTASESSRKGLSKYWQAVVILD